MHRSSPPSRSSTSSTKPLKRGKACLTCRFLKIKCDGARPVCGPCQRHPKDDPCEYADGPGRSRTRALEDTVSRLEARLREYENPHETPSVSLHNPYGQPSENPALRLTVPSIPQPKGEPHSAHPSPPSPYSTLSPLAAPSPSSVSSNTSSIRTTSRSPAADSEEPSPPMIRILLDTFYVHGSTFGFFLNMSRFSNDILTLPQGHPLRPCPGLLNTVYLLGVHLSPEPLEARRSREQTLLLRALRDTATDLVTTHPNRVLHTIQAETLLAYYFFRAGNILEAKRHASSAASLVLGCGLHRIRSSTNWSSSSSPVSVGPGGLTSLPGARDAVEEGERINAFWTVFTLYRNLAVAVSPSEVCGIFDAPGMQVDTPWPLDMESYKEGMLPPAGASTIWNYLNHTQPQNDEYEHSTNTFVAKTSILLHQAVFLAGQYHPNMTQKDSQPFYAAFQSLNHLIDTTRMQLPALPGPAMNADATNPSTRPVYLSHALIQAATIRLHGIFSYSDAASRQVCLDAAKAMLKGPADGGIDVQLFGSVNPIMGTLWMLSCQVLIEELGRVRSLRGHAWPAQSTAGDEEELLSRLQAGFAALEFFSGSSDLMSEYSSNIRGLLGGGWLTEPNAYGDSQGLSTAASSPSSSTITSTTPLGSPGTAMQPVAAVDDWSPRSTESSLSGDGSECSGDQYQLHDQSSTLSTLFHPSGVVGYPNTHDTSVPRYGHSHTHGHVKDYGHGQEQHHYSATSSPTIGQYTPPFYDAPYTSLTVSY